MIRSMTAFARSSVSTRESTWVVEIRSLNHRYFEFSLKVPPALSVLESRIRDLVHADIARGKVVVNILQDTDAKRNKALAIDEDVVKLYLDASKKLKKQFGLEGETTLQDVVKLPGVFTTESKKEDPEKTWPSLKRVIKQALDAAAEAKSVEGVKLSKDIEERLQKICKAVQKIEKLSHGRAERIFKKLKERVDLLLEDKEKDPERLQREVALLADRCDITEELVRIVSHLQLFQSRLKKKGEVGRELDFLCQEMNREINTMGSKAQLFEISTEVVMIKGEIEKIREQVQNIE